MENALQTKELFDAPPKPRGDAPAPLYEYIAGQLLDRLSDLKEKPAPFFDWDAKSMAVTEKLSANGYMQGGAPYGLLFSTLQLQSMNSVPATLKAFHASLNQDGLFMGTMLGGETLFELRSSLIEAESNLSGGIRPRTLPMMKRDEISRLFLNGGFAHPVIDSELVTLTFKDIWGLMRSLRAMGLTNNLKDRPKHLTPRSLFTEADKIYKKRFGTEAGGIKATFEIFYLHGWINII